MSVAGTIDGDLIVRGALVAQSVPLPASAVSDSSVAAAADIAATKLEHQHEISHSQALGVDAATESRVIHVVYGATGTIIAFRAGAVTVAGAATTVTVDLKKNGTTVLSAVITLSNAQTAYQLVSGTISSAALVTGDVLSVTYTLSGANEPQGCFCQAVIREDAA